ncbi:MAG: hypothetical protein R3F59_29255 [Myxococcota bacterium]
MTQQYPAGAMDLAVRPHTSAVLADFALHAPERMTAVMDAITEGYLRERLPEPVRDRLQRHATRLGLGVGAHPLSRLLGTSVLTHISDRLAGQALSAPMVRALLLRPPATLTPRALQGSARLATAHPAIYAELAPVGLDLVWFLLEGQLAALAATFRVEVDRFLAET